MTSLLVVPAATLVLALAAVSVAGTPLEDFGANKQSRPRPTTGSAPASQATATAARDGVIVEDMALAMLVAIRDKDDDALKAQAADIIKGWRDALPQFAMEMREKFRQMTGKPFDMRVGESLVSGNLAVVKCTGPEELKGTYLVLHFARTDSGWRNYSLRNSPGSMPLEKHLRDATSGPASRATTQASQPYTSATASRPSTSGPASQPLGIEALEAGKVNISKVRADELEGILQNLNKLNDQAPAAPEGAAAAKLAAKWLAKVSDELVSRGYHRYEEPMVYRPDGSVVPRLPGADSPTSPRVEDLISGAMELSAPDLPSLESFLQNLTKRKDYDLSMHDGEPGPDNSYLVEWSGTIAKELAHRGYQLREVMVLYRADGSVVPRTPHQPRDSTTQPDRAGDVKT